MVGTVTPDDVRAFVHGMWANVAASWAAHADEIDERATPVTEQMLELAELEAGQRVLELASGPDPVQDGLSARQQARTRPGWLARRETNRADALGARPSRLS
jgi:hypothetical protein